MLKAIRTGNYYRLEELLKNNNIDINEKDANGRTYLHHACDYNKTKISKILLKYGANSPSDQR